MSIPFRLAAWAVAGFALGTVIGVAGWVQPVKFLTFWGGLMWPLLLGAAISFTMLRRRGQATPALAVAVGAVVGLTPAAWRESRGLSNDELWFPLVMVAATGICLAHACLALSRRLRNRAG